VDRLKSFNWLTYYGGKFSTSQQRGIFMGDALELLPADYWRWFLMANAPESDDSSFTWELFSDSVNKDLVGTFGNFVNRTASQVSRHFGEVVPSGGESEGPEDELWLRIDDRLGEYLEAMDALQFRRAAASLRSLWVEGNVYLETREPWKTVKEDRERTACTLRTAVQLACLYSVVSEAMVPGASQRLGAAFPEVTEDLVLDRGLPQRCRELVTAGSAFEKPDMLFTKLAPETIEEWAGRFGGAGG
jgi:methionyl-tRNA synthetase